MKQVFAAFAGAGLTAAACFALGLLLLERLRIGDALRRAERLPLAFAPGAAMLHLAVFLLCALRIAYWPVLVAVLILPVAEASRRRLWRPQGHELSPVPRLLAWALGGMGLAFAGIYFVYALAPERSPDGSAYHLGLVARELRVHGFEKITTSIYAMLGQGIELVYLPAFAIGRHSAAALTHLAFGVSLAISIATFGRRLGKPWVGGAAAVLTFASPVFGISTSVAYIDAAAASVVFAAFYWLEVWEQERVVSNDSWRLLIPVGLLAGYAYASKYTAAAIALYAVGLVAWKARQWRPVALVAACAVLMAGPWIARNWLLYENPLAPLGNALFRNPYVHVMFEREYTEYLRSYQVENLWTLPLEVTLRGEKTQGLVGPLFLLLPLGLTALTRRAGRRVWLAGIVVASTYLANIGTRFLIPCLPFFSLSIAMALAESELLLGAVMLVHSVLSWPTVVPRYAAEHAWRMDGFPWRAALRLQDSDAFLRETLDGYAAARMIDAHVPRGTAVFTQGNVREAYSQAEILVNFQSASNEVAADQFHMGWLVGNQPIRRDVLRFPEVQTRRMRVTQTVRAPAGEQWSVHELRFYSKGSEVARRPDWRLQAWPMPWDVGMAFDNSPATRWRSWETAAPGMYLEVDFGREETVDEIRVERSTDSTAVRTQPEVPGPGGVWETIAARTESVDAQPNPNARRMATYELHQRGIDYFFFFDSDFGAEDVREDPESWGLAKVATIPGSRLYKSIWK